MQGGEPSHIPQPHGTGYRSGSPVGLIATLRAACPKVVLSLPTRMRMLRPLVRVQKIRALEAVPCEVGKASAVSDSGIHGILVNWTESKGVRAAEVARALLVSVALYPFFIRSMEAAANPTALLA